MRTRSGVPSSSSFVVPPPRGHPLSWFLTRQGRKNRTLVDHERLMCSKHVSQKRNEAIDNYQWYEMLLNLWLNFKILEIRIENK